MVHNAITTSAYPPAVGWFIDGAICEELEVVMSFQNNQEPAMMPGPSQQAAQESPVPPFPTPAAPAIYVSHRRSIQNINGITGRTRTKKRFFQIATHWCSREELTPEPGVEAESCDRPAQNFELLVWGCTSLWQMFVHANEPTACHRLKFEMLLLKGGACQ